MKILTKAPIFTLTPKGALCAALGAHTGHKAWDVLCRHAKQVCDYTEQRGTPAVLCQQGGKVTGVK